MREVQSGSDFYGQFVRCFVKAFQQEEEEQQKRIFVRAGNKNGNSTAEIRNVRVKKTLPLFVFVGLLLQWKEIIVFQFDETVFNSFVW